MKLGSRWYTETQVADLRKASGTSAPSKYHAQRVEIDNIRFQSKKEGRRYQELRALQHAGEVKFFLRQCPFHLPGNVKYLLDFLVFWTDGRITYEDVKGKKLPLYILKKKQVEALFPIKITEL